MLQHENLRRMESWLSKAAHLRGEALAVCLRQAAAAPGVWSFLPFLALDSVKHGVTIQQPQVLAAVEILRLLALGRYSRSKTLIWLDWIRRCLVRIKSFS
jgi:hypothetical protein